MAKIEKYDNIAVILHWIIALAIILQLGSGIWMVQAIENENSRKTAYLIYQYHKSLGLSVLIFSLFRLFWRIKHTPPVLPSHMTNIEKLAANIFHKLLYLFMIFIPLIGWGLVSTSSYGFPTMFFNLFEWPHISFLNEASNKVELHQFFDFSHKIMSYLLIALLFLHISAALKHQFFDKDNLIRRILP